MSEEVSSGRQNELERYVLPPRRRGSVRNTNMQTHVQVSKCPSINSTPRYSYILFDHILSEPLSGYTRKDAPFPCPTYSHTLDSRLLGSMDRKPFHTKVTILRLLSLLVSSSALSKWHCLPLLHSLNSRFLHRPLSSFGGLIPLFVQFVDMHVQAINLRNESLYTNALLHISSLLRPNVIYLAVSQDDQVSFYRRLCFIPVTLLPSRLSSLLSSLLSGAWSPRSFQTEHTYPIRRGVWTHSYPPNQRRAALCSTSKEIRHRSQLFWAGKSNYSLTHPLTHPLASSWAYQSSYCRVFRCALDSLDTECWKRLQRSARNSVFDVANLGPGGTVPVPCMLSFTKTFFEGKE